jgi:hypothetical protein
VLLHKVGARSSAELNQHFSPDPTGDFPLLPKSLFILQVIDDPVHQSLNGANRYQLIDPAVELLVTEHDFCRQGRPGRWHTHRRVGNIGGLRDTSY